MDGLALHEAEEASAETGQTTALDKRDERFAGPRVSDVLGHAVRSQPPPKAQVLFERVVGTVRSWLAVLLRPRVAGVLIFGLGVLIMLLLGYIYLFTPLSEGRAQHTLLQEITASPAKTFDLAEGKLPPEGTPVAVLEIPALHQTDAVVQGTDAQDLRLGPGHMPTTALPGQPGNAVIAGRRATFGAPFGAIGSLKKGQLIIVVDGYGTYHYKVKRVVYAEGGRHDVVTETAANRLTLVTAASGFFPRGRLAVIAQLEGKPLADATEPHFHVASAELGLAGDPASGLLAIFWCIVFFVLLSAAAWLVRRWNQPVVVYVLAVPVLLLVALFACESIIGFLPATV
jgi:sortase A